MTNPILPTALGESYLSPDQFPALITLEEGFVATVYDDGKRNVTIGWGFNLSGAQNRDKLALVLNQLGVFNAVTHDNAQTILDNFGAIVDGYQTTYRGSIALESAALFAELQHYLPDATAFSITSQQCNNIVDELVLGYNIANGAFSSTGYQSALNSLLTSLGPGASSLVVAGDTPSTITNSSSEYMALMSLYYANPNLIGKDLQAALMSGNRADAWYQIRYLSNSDDTAGTAKRRYWEAQLFGLTAPGGDSLAQAEQALGVLASDRDYIIGYEQDYGADPDGSRPETGTKSITTANQGYDNFGRPFPLGYAPQTISAPAGNVPTLAQAYDADAGVLEQWLMTTYAGIVPDITPDSNGSSVYTTSPFNVRSTDVLVAPSGIDVDSANDIRAGDDPQANHILIGAPAAGVTGSIQDILTGGTGNDILLRLT